MKKPLLIIALSIYLFATKQSLFAEQHVTFNNQSNYPIMISYSLPQNDDNWLHINLEEIPSKTQALKTFTIPGNALIHFTMVSIPERGFAAEQLSKVSFMCHLPRLISKIPSAQQYVFDLNFLFCLGDFTNSAYLYINSSTGEETVLEWHS